jgi:hypothetical protein
MTKQTITINVAMEYDAEDLWTSVTGSGWETMPWWKKAKYSKATIASWNDGGDPSTYAIEVEIDDPEDEEKVIAKTVTLADIAEACPKVWASKLHHCGSRIDSNIDNYDSCVGDIIMQMVMLGEVIYG